MLDLLGQLSASEERMQVAHEELQDLKGVWAELSKIWEQIDELKEKPWLSVQPRKVGTNRQTCRTSQLYLKMFLKKNRWYPVQPYGK